MRLPLTRNLHTRKPSQPHSSPLLPHSRPFLSLALGRKQNWRRRRRRRKFNRPSKFGAVLGFGPINWAAGRSAECGWQAAGLTAARARATAEPKRANNKSMAGQSGLLVAPLGLTRCGGSGASRGALLSWLQIWLRSSNNNNNGDGSGGNSGDSDEPNPLWAELDSDWRQSARAQFGSFERQIGRENGSKARPSGRATRPAKEQTWPPICRSLAELGRKLRNGRAEGRASASLAH